MLSSYIFACAWSLLEDCIIVGITYIAREVRSYLDGSFDFNYISSLDPLLPSTQNRFSVRFRCG
jgi:hypothetical protein